MKYFQFFVFNSTSKFLYKKSVLNLARYSFELLFIILIFKSNLAFKLSHALSNQVVTSTKSRNSLINLIPFTKNLKFQSNFKFKRDVNLTSDFTANTTDTSKKNNNFDPIWYLNKFGYLDPKQFQTGIKKSGRLIMVPSSLSDASASSSSLFRTNNEAVLNAVKKFQKFANINVTGRLDNETLKMMKMPRCGHPDILNDDLYDSSTNLDFNVTKSFKNRKKRYALQGSKWTKTKLHFRVAKYPKFSSMTRELIDQELNRAFSLWSDVSAVEFEQVKETKNLMNMLLLYGRSGPSKPTDSADIEVRFETGYHGDSEPFDGSGLILDNFLHVHKGHAYFPEFGGNTHFDADEFWTSRSSDGVNLFQVAVHEFGHALGLEHSDNFDAIMAPFFRGYAEDFRLHPDDLTAIELLYGKNKRQVPDPNKFYKNLKPDSQIPNAIFNFNNQNDGNNVNVDLATYKPWTLPNFFTSGKPPLTSTNNFPGFVPFFPQNFPFPSISTSPPRFTHQNPEYFDSSANSLCLDGKFDAISLLSDGFTYIFKDAYVYKVDSNFNMAKNYPRLISTVFRGWGDSGSITLPNKLDTVLYIPENGMTFFFKDTLYWRSSKLYDLDPGYPRLISENFKGLNQKNGFFGKLDASFVWSGNRRTYFIQGNRYWRFDFVTGTIERGYPKKITVWRGLPQKITSAFLWTNGVTYFFSGDKYYRFNDLSFKVEDSYPPYPRFNVEYWFGCTNVNRLGKLIYSTSANSQAENMNETNPESLEYETVEVPMNINFLSTRTTIEKPQLTTTEKILLEEMNQKKLTKEATTKLFSNKLNQTEIESKSSNQEKLKDDITHKFINSNILTDSEKVISSNSACSSFNFINQIRFRKFYFYHLLFAVVFLFLYFV